MFFTDAFKYLVDETSDGGDSSMRAGMYSLFSFVAAPGLLNYNKAGLCVRHPVQVPWNNPWNFTRDQLIPYTAGLYAQELHFNAEDIFFKHLKRGFFCQNFERDYPGSTKYPWPHSFINDKGQKETRLFDFADPLMPDHIWHLIKCAKLYPLYWFALLGIPWFVLSLYFHSRSSHKEHNQIICQAMVNGRWAVRLFKKLVPNWKADVREYWDSRNEGEYATLIIEGIE